ncbi:hypothetical protein ACNKHP_14835 [Shigella boydii]
MCSGSAGGILTPISSFISMRWVIFPQPKALTPSNPLENGLTLVLKNIRVSSAG